MTKSNRITPNVRFEGITVAHTTVSNRFAKLLWALDACIAAERPLQRGTADIFAPFFDTALTEAEMAREALLSSLTAVIVTTEERTTDRPLRLMAMALKTLLAIECDGDRAHVFGSLLQNVDLLEVQGTHPAVMAVRRVQERFFRGCALLMSMQDFGGPGPDGDGAFGPALAA